MSKTGDELLPTLVTLAWCDTPASLRPPGLETQVFSTHIQLAQDNIYTVICNSALKLIFWPCVGINVTVSYNYPTEIQPCPALPKLSWNTAMLCFAWDFLKYNPTIAIQRYRGSAEAAVAWAYLWFLLLSLSFFQSIGIPVIPQRGSQHPGLCSVTLGRFYTFISVEFNLEHPVSWSNMLAKSALTVFHVCSNVIKC